MIKSSIYLCGILLLCCACDRASDRDINSLTDNQLKNNLTEIDQIKLDMIGLEIEKLPRNIELLDNLKRMHAEILLMADSVETMNKNAANKRILNFIERNFKDLTSFNQEPLAITQSIAPSLLRLHVSKLEAFLINEKRGQYDFPDNKIAFDHVTLQIIPTKTIINKNEKIAGHLVLSAVASFKNSRKMVKKMTLNGKEIIAGENGWGFEIKPGVTKSGLNEYELKAEVELGDTTLITKQVILVKN